MDSDRQAPRTTTIYHAPRDRRLLELAAEARGVGVCTYVRLVALEAAERDVLEVAGGAPGAEPANE